jgi:hypothetical protein
MGLDLSFSNFSAMIRCDAEGFRPPAFTWKQGLAYGINTRVREIMLCFAVLTLFSTAAYAGDLSNKWRINVNHSAKSDGTMLFRVSPKEQPAIDITVNIKDRTRENKVAVAIKDAFQAQLPKDGYHIERDDSEDVLVKKRGDTPKFGLELISSNVRKVTIKLKKE